VAYITVMLCITVICLHCRNLQYTSKQHSFEGGTHTVWKIIRHYMRYLQ
jgi:hypothetical protein